MEPTPKPNDIEKYNLFGDALSKIVGHYFKEFEEYIQKLDKYYREMVYHQLEHTSGETFVCVKCGFHADVDHAPECECKGGSLFFVCFYCVHFAEGVEKLDEKTFRCTGCQTIVKVPKNLPPRQVKPLPPRLPE